MLSFGVLIAFFITKAIPDWGEFFGILKQIQNTRSMGSCTFHPGRNSIRLPPFYTRLLPPFHPAAKKLSTRLPPLPLRCRHFPPGCITSGNLLTPFHPDVHIRNSDAGWERRTFQLPRSHISRSAYSSYPESFAAILHSARVFSWSFPIVATDIVRYSSLDFLMSKSPFSPCNPPIIGFLSY